jgi:CrcB protein
MKEMLCVGAGGACGAVLRYIMSFIVQKKLSVVFPLPTFVVNMTGCLVIGVLYALMRDLHSGAYTRLFFLVGLTGAFTTFSTFSLENLELLRSGNISEFILYSFGSVLLGVFLVYLSFNITRLIH